MTQTQTILDLFDDDPSAEILEDIHVGEKSLSNAVLYNTDWTVETLIRQVEKSAIDLNPSFQRRDAWTKKRKSQFIESILLNFPVPPLTLAEKSNTKSFIVVDGKQRLTTLSQFFGQMVGSPNNGFALEGLEELGRLNGVTCGQIAEIYPDLFMRLENYSIRTNVIRGWQSDDVLYSIFLRLNSGSVKLSPQELRQALHPGPFANFLLDFSESSDGLRSIFAGPGPDFRMRDLELLARYFGFQVHIEEYRGDLKKFLDFTVERVNKNWEKVEGNIKQIADSFEQTHSLISDVFTSDNVYRKWNGDFWERRLNRAVFDVMTFFPRTDEERNLFRARGREIVAAFQELCDDEYDFRDAIETTTKSVGAVTTRIGFWGKVLKDLGIIQNNIYVDGEGRIRYDGQLSIF